MRLVQKKLFKGTREFEIIEDVVNFRIRTPLREEKLTVDMRVLNPEPVTNGDCLEFQSRVNREALLSLWIDRPDASQFDAFVDRLRRGARDAYNDFARLRPGTIPEGMEANVFEEPPEFGESAQPSADKQARPVRVADIDVSIRMLEQHLGRDGLEPLISALEALKTDAENEAMFRQLVDAFDALGPRQGAVLTYAPYLSILLSDDPFGY